MKEVIKIPTEKDIERILITEEQIQARVRELAQQISQDYIKEEVKEIFTVPFLKGATYFFADLTRRMDLSISECFDTTIVSSYGKEFESSENVKTILDLCYDIKGRDVLVIEDVIDTGLTLSSRIKVFSSREPKSLKVCVFLDKPERRSSKLKDFKVDYVGFRIPDVFVVGYGLDYNERCRNWPFIAVLKEEYYKP